MAALSARQRLSAAARLRRERPNVLAVVAHPDDAELAFGATLLGLAKRGARVHLVVVTSGERGCRGTWQPARLARLRRAEQRAAAALAGVYEVRFLGLADGGLAGLQEPLRERITRLIRCLRPDSLYTLDPHPHYFDGPQARLLGPINHPDHRAVGEACLAAAHCESGLPAAYPAHRRHGLLPWKPKTIYLAWTQRPNLSVDVGALLPRKRALLRCFATQGLDDPALLARLDRRERFRRLDLA